GAHRHHLATEDVHDVGVGQRGRELIANDGRVVAGAVRAEPALREPSAERDQLERKWEQQCPAPTRGPKLHDTNALVNKRREPLVLPNDVRHAPKATFVHALRHDLDLVALPGQALAQAHRDAFDPTDRGPVAAGYERDAHWSGWLGLGQCVGGWSRAVHRSMPGTDPAYLSFFVRRSLIGSACVNSAGTALSTNSSVQ